MDSKTKRETNKPERAILLQLGSMDRVTLARLSALRAANIKIAGYAKMNLTLTLRSAAGVLNDWAPTLLAAEDLFWNRPQLEPARCLRKIRVQRCSAARPSPEINSGNKREKKSQPSTLR